MREYQRCVKCIMDTTDKEIVFDDNGVCNHCKSYEKIVKQRTFFDEKNKHKFQEKIDEMKETGKKQKYDCILGISGGVDSCYTAYLLKKNNINTLAVHFDNGWDSELSVKNIEKVVKKLDIDLYTYVVDWEEFKDLQISFLKASVPDADIITDHGFFGAFYYMAEKEKIKHIVIGDVAVTECLLPGSWTYGIQDWRYINAIHKEFGKVPIKTFPHYNYLLFRYYRNKYEIVKILDYIKYDQDEAKKLIQNELGWVDYGGKHHESIYTRFFQCYYLPNKFNIDKRLAHYSNLICSGQMNRGQALEKLQSQPYSDAELEDIKNYVIKKYAY